jgi:cyclohexanone monooxygenase
LAFDRFAGSDEYTLIYEKADPELQVIMDLLYLTGQRVMAVIGIKLADLLDEGIYFPPFKTGFDAVTGGLINIDIRGTDGATLREKWTKGVRTYQGLANAGFPNLMVTYGPQAPTAFCNGPSSAEYQGDFIVECLEYLRARGLTRMEATREAEEAWKNQCADLANATLFPKADSWYMGANIPGKPRMFMPYIGGVGVYRQKCDEVAGKGYEGFQLT